MLKNLLNDEAGMIISAELTLVLSIAVLAMVVGLTEVATAVTTELNDVGNAIGSLNQSFTVTGFCSISGGKLKSFVAGSSFADGVDDCDRDTSCDIVSGANFNNHEGY